MTHMCTEPQTITQTTESHRAHVWRKKGQMCNPKKTVPAVKEQRRLWEMLPSVWKGELIKVEEDRRMMGR